MRSGMGMMGEAGPEAIMPLSRGPDGKLGVRGGGGDTVNVVMNIQTPDAQSFQRSQGQIAARMSRALSQESPMNFHDVRFPASLSFGSVGGPERRTDIVTLANGFEERNTPWAHSRRRYDAGLGMRSLDDIETLIAFYEARRGQMFGFRWKDWSDFKSCGASAGPIFDDQVIAEADGVAQAFQLIKTYRSGEFTYARPITKP
ncbi:unnamed protein product, partial [Ectocarpus sp. 12 AP-2014]